MEHIIEFRNVSKYYGTKKVLNGLSFTIDNNEYVGLIGNNGCGKTTTVNILCNLSNYDSGDVLVFNKRVDDNYVIYKNRFGIILSKPHYIEDFYPAEYLYFVAKFHKVSEKDISNRIKDITEIVTLRNLSKPIKHLSSGDQMKVSIAAALIHNPDILILDEPFIHLDISSTDNFIMLLNELKKSKTLLVTSHQLDLTTSLCDKFLIMHNGTIISTLYKNDFSSLDDLKIIIRERLIDQRMPIDMSWLK